jgi:hypothetical protein
VATRIERELAGEKQVPVSVPGGDSQ